MNKGEKLFIFNEVPQAGKNNKGRTEPRTLKLLWANGQLGEENPPRGVKEQTKNLYVFLS